MTKRTDQELLNDHMDATTKTIRKALKVLRKGGFELKDGTDIYDLPLECVDTCGREYAVVLCTGGPHIEVAADGLNRARLEGYWWGTRATRHGDIYSEFLDYFIERG